MKKNLITTLTIASVFATACSPKNEKLIIEKHFITEAPNQSTEIIQGTLTQRNAFAEFERILLQSEGNIAVAEALAGYYRAAMGPSSVSHLKDLSNGSLLMLMDLLNKDLEQKRLSLILSANIHSPSSMLGYYGQSINKSHAEKVDGSQFASDLRFKIAMTIQSAAFENIVGTYNKAIEDHSLYITKHFLETIHKEDKSFISKIDATKNIESRASRLAEITSLLKTADRYLVAYSIKGDDQARAIIYAAVAGILVNKVKDTPTVLALIDVATEIKTVKDKAEQVIVLTRSLKEAATSLKSNTQVAYDTGKSLVENLKKYDVTMNSLRLSDEGRQSARTLLNDLMNGKSNDKVKKVGDDEIKEKGLFERANLLNAEAMQFVTASQNAANSLNSVVNITRSLSKSLNIKLGSNVEEALQTATKISNAVNLGVSVANAFQKGGLVGAMQVFSGGPATMALAAFGGGMSGGPDPAIMAELAAIKQSLVEIKALQKEILENQMKTMQMISSLANMVHDFHIQQLSRLKNLEEDVISSKHAVEVLAEKEFRQCLPLIFPMQTQYGSIDFALRAQSIDTLKSLVSQRISKDNGLNVIVRSTSTLNYQACQEALSNSFIDANFFSRNAELDTNGFRVAKYLYEPALAFMIESNKDYSPSSLIERGLHLPSTDIHSLVQFKSDALKASLNHEQAQILAPLVSAKKLERYATVALVLHPYLALDKASDWQSLQTDFFNKIGKIDFTSRSESTLQAAFNLTTLGIMQESILSGEPLLKTLSDLHFEKIVAAQDDCEAGTQSEIEMSENFCFVRKNGLLMTNLLKYHIKQKLNLSGRNGYQDLYERKDLQGLQLFLGLSKAESRIVETKNGQLLLFLSKDQKIIVELPSIEEVLAGEIEYSASMKRLLVLQDKLAREIAKLRNSQLSNDNLKLITRSLIGK